MTDQQELIVLTMVLRPFVLLVLFAVVLWPARVAVQKFMKDSKLKRLLLYRFNP